MVGGRGECDVTVMEQRIEICLAEVVEILRLGEYVSSRREREREVAVGVFDQCRSLIERPHMAA